MISNTTTLTFVSTADGSYEDCYVSDNPELNVFPYLYIAVICLGIPANLFSLFVSWQHIRQGNELGVYLFSLALSDLLFIMGLPAWVDFMFNDKWRFSGNACLLCVFILFTNFYTSVALLCCIALDRYLAVVHPLKFPSLRSLRTAVSITISAWVLTIAFILITVSRKEIYDEKYDICLDVFPLGKRRKQVFIARFFVGFFGPSVLVWFCSWRICVAVQNNQATRDLERRRVRRLMGAVLLTLWLCFGPIHITFLLRAVLEKCTPPYWLFCLYKVSKALSCLNCLVDPLLYCFITRAGRKNITQAFLLLQRKGRFGSNEEPRTSQNEQYCCSEVTVCRSQTDVC
ncbi:G protein-coupled receptor 65 [Chanos chanos]|uniref:G protein-coupled receptor 65 n=1 Tax=Chanos chanos TaxID=29144 RepID=A0A6J2WLP3_CHACN|nr:psychosine receptor-like [Chanos chanos]